MKNKIKVCFFIGSFQAGGAENLVLNILRHIDTKKFDPYLCVFSKNGALRELFQSLGVPIKEFKFNNKLNALYEFFRFIKFLVKEKIQVIHINLVGIYLFSMTGAVIAGVNNRIVHWHNVYEKPRTNKYRSVKFGSLLSTKIIAISNVVKYRNCDIYNINKSKVVTIYNAVDVISFSIDKENYNSKVILGTVGKLTEQKGYDILLKAYKEVADHFSDLKLEIIGTGYLESDLKNLSKKLGITNSVRFLGSMPNESVVERMNNWSVFILTSRWEGFGIVLIEAMALEKPVVATKVDAIPEVVEDGVTGYLCESENHHEIAQAIITLLKDKEKAREMGKLGRKRVERYFTIEKMVNDLERIYSIYILYHY